MTARPPTRVLLVLDSLVPGGAERSTVDMIPELQRRGFQLEVAVLHDRPGLQSDVVATGSPLHDLSGSGGRLGWTRRLRHLMASRQPDLVHTTLFEADVCGRTAARSLGLPVLSTLATEHYGAAHLDAGHLNRGKVRAAQLLDIVTARMTTRLHAVSHHVADTMAERLRYPRHRIDVVYRGRPAELARPGPPTAGVEPAIGLGSGPVVLLVARHEQAKGIDRALAAFPAVLASCPGAVLAVAGRPGPHTPELEAAIARLGLGASVRLLGHRCDVPQLLAASDAFVLPSRREGLPGSLLEAMAVGTPAVVNGLPQVREVARPEHALVVDAADPEALAAALVATLTDRTAARERAERAREHFLTMFTLEQAADGMAEVYHRCLDQKERR